VDLDGSIIDVQATALSMATSSAIATVAVGSADPTGPAVGRLHRVVRQRGGLDRQRPGGEIYRPALSVAAGTTVASSARHERRRATTAPGSTVATANRIVLQTGLTADLYRGHARIEKRSTPGSPATIATSPAIATTA
jgi:hypothetical protein